LGGEDYSLKFDNLLIQHGSVADRYERLRHVMRKLEGRDGSGDKGHIGH
jgi:hypothetical protein